MLLSVAKQLFIFKYSCVSLQGKIDTWKSKLTLRQIVIGHGTCILYRGMFIGYFKTRFRDSIKKKKKLF